MGLNEPLNYLSSGRIPMKLVTVVSSGEGTSLLCLMRGGQSSVAFKSLTLETSACPLVVVWVFNLKGSQL